MFINFQGNVLSVFGHFVGLTLKGLKIGEDSQKMTNSGMSI